MALPDSPLTRAEEYLNNIATGEGTIPDVPYTRIEQYLDYIAKNGGSGGSGGSGGGVFLVNDNDGTLDKTMGEIQDAYLSGKRVIISVDGDDKAVLGIIPVHVGKGDYFGRIRTYETVVINQSRVLVQSYYSTFSETEEAARNAYPVYSA